MFVADTNVYRHKSLCLCNLSLQNWKQLSLSLLPSLTVFPSISFSVIGEYPASKWISLSLSLASLSTKLENFQQASRSLSLALSRSCISLHNWRIFSKQEAAQNELILKPKKRATDFSEIFRCGGTPSSVTQSRGLRTDIIFDEILPPQSPPRSAPSSFVLSDTFLRGSVVRRRRRPFDFHCA